MHEQELRQHRCCFTGHRPEKLNISEEQLCVRLGLGTPGGLGYRPQEIRLQKNKRPLSSLRTSA